MSSVVHSSATSSAAFSGATDSPDTNTRRSPAERGLVLSQRDKNHLIWGTFDAFALAERLAGLAISAQIGGMLPDEQASPEQLAIFRRMTPARRLSLAEHLGGSDGPQRARRMGRPAGSGGAVAAGDASIEDFARHRLRPFDPFASIILLATSRSGPRDFVREWVPSESGPFRGVRRSGDRLGPRRGGTPSPYLQTSVKRANAFEKTWKFNSVKRAENHGRGAKRYLNGFLSPTSNHTPPPPRSNFPLSPDGQM